MWSKLFGGGEGLPREKVDAVVNVMSPDTVVREVSPPGDLRDRAAGTMKQSVMSNKTNIYLIYY